MRPVLFSLELGGHRFALPTYGVLVAAGLALGIVLVWREGQRQRMNGARLLDLCFWGLLAGLGGARAAYVALNARAFAAACWGDVAPDAAIRGCAAALRFWEGGLVYYGGLAGTAAVVAYFCRRERWSFWRLGDVIVPGLAVGHAIGRVGCLAAGCCFGKACAAPWAVHFGPGSVAFEELRSDGTLAAAAAHTPGLHPTQLYEAAGELALFALLLALRRRWRRSDSALGPGASARAPGGLLLTYVGGYAFLRLLVETFRGDVARKLVAAFSTPALARAVGLPPAEPLFLYTSQLASIVAALAVVAAVWWRRRRAQTTGAAAVR
jgi:phosphatidylglycerol:prolipoprotein diacylglycerol transferase